MTSVLPDDLDGPGTRAIVCGPEIMMLRSAEALVERGVPARRVRLSMERNMHCGVGICGHCLLREHVVCLDGPVFDYPQVAALLTVPEL